MSVLTFRALRRRALCGSAIAAALGFASAAGAQTQLPEVVVTAPKEKEKPKPKPVQVRAAPRPAAAPSTARRPLHRRSIRSPRQRTPSTRASTPSTRRSAPFRHRSVTTRSRRCRGATIHGRKDTAAGSRRHAGFGRQRQLPRPQRARQCAGPHQRHHAAGRRYRLRHVPRHRADRQHIADYRRAAGRNSACAPPACSTSGPAAMPSTAALSASMAAARQTFTPSFEYGGQVGQTQYFLTGRFFESNIGLENPTPNWAAIHDHTTQERGFGYVSTILDPYTRFTLMAGASYGAFQIPNTPGQTPNFTAFGISNFNSALLNENQFEQSYFMVAALAALDQRRRRAIVLFQRATAAFISFPTRSATSSSTGWRPKSFAPILPTA